MTKQYRFGYWMFLILSVLLNVAPLLGYVIAAVLQSNLVYEKIALTTTVFIVLILSIVSLINKIHLRSMLWITLIGVYICLKEIMTPLMIIACCQVLDELIVCPLKSYNKTRLIINKELDKRS